MLLSDLAHTRLHGRISSNKARRTGGLVVFTRAFPYQYLKPEMSAIFLVTGHPTGGPFVRRI